MSDQSPSSERALISALSARSPMKMLSLILSSALSVNACQQTAELGELEPRSPITSRLSAQSEPLTGSLIQLEAPVDYECVPLGGSALALIQVKELVRHGDLGGYYSRAVVELLTPDELGLESGVYVSWCLQERTLIDTPEPEEAWLRSDLPGDVEYARIDLARITFLLNNRDGASDASVQHAIWILTGDRRLTDVEVDSVSSGVTQSDPAVVKWLVTRAMNEGGGFLPGADEIAPIVVQHTGGEQLMILEFQCVGEPPSDAPPSDPPADPPPSDPPADPPPADPPADRPQLRTQTPGGWGTACRGGNPGCYRDAHFDAAFPEGLRVGATRNESGASALFTSSGAIRAVLPSGGRPRSLSGSFVDPRSLRNALAGHAIALTLSVTFDRYDPDFGEADVDLGAQVLAGGPCEGMSVDEVLREANRTLAGAPRAMRPSLITECAATINESYVDGDEDSEALTLP